jgi:hypothetical protein
LGTTPVVGVTGAVGCVSVSLSYPFPYASEGRMLATIWPSAPLGEPMMCVLCLKQRERRRGDDEVSAFVPPVGFSCARTLYAHSYVPSARGSTRRYLTSARLAYYSSPLDGGAARGIENHYSTQEARRPAMKTLMAVLLMFVLSAGTIVAQNPNPPGPPPPGQPGQPGPPPFPNPPHPG